MYENLCSLIERMVRTGHGSEPEIAKPIEEPVEPEKSGSNALALTVGLPVGLGAVVALTVTGLVYGCRRRRSGANRRIGRVRYQKETGQAVTANKFDDAFTKERELGAGGQGTVWLVHAKNDPERQFVAKFMSVTRTVKRDTV